ncbi:MAG: glycoside hydrolase family 25 protein, partial [Candidatus Thermoplasmatota archaeon]|nr:glycoside hydrolase family 25 protein [Candidatus Thermoplasmatota archaeon]
MVGISELSKDVSKETGTTQKQAREVIKTFLDRIVAEANKKNKIN